MVRVVLVGANGRLGKAIREINSVSTNIVACIGTKNAGEFATAAKNTDVVVDVSLPTATVELVDGLLKAKSKTPYVIGCTGWTETQMKTVRAYSKHSCVVFAPNFAPGVNLFLGLLEKAAPYLKAWGYDVSIHETHHTKKLDSPSGTAKAIVERLGGMSSEIRSTRAGDVVGIHEVRFSSRGDVLTFTHEALDRSIFASGALMAAEWAAQHRGTPGFYSMQDVVFSTP